MLFHYNPSAGLLLLRVALAVVFIAHGAQKLFGVWGGGGIAGTADGLGQMGFPAPMFLATLVGTIEFGGGILLAFGLFTQVAALLIACVMLTALLVVHLPRGFFVAAGGIEFVMMNLAAAITLVFAGAGRYSIDEGLKRDVRR